MALAPFAAVVGVFFGIPNQYTETYVGELTEMYARLCSVEEPKIIVVGGSSVAFGLRSDLVEQELSMPCINFGLYGTIGTKAMMDLSKANIGEGDIVILAPETASQPMSMYFNPDAMLRAVNGDLSMMLRLGKDDLMEMVNELPGYISTNFEVYTGKATVDLTGVYQKSSFNEYCDIAYERPYNVMPELYDSVAEIRFSPDDIEREFIDYVNEYAAYVRECGAEIYYSFCPMNELAVVSGAEEIAAYENFLYENLDMEIISNASDYIFDAQLFYDTNFHCNDAGVVYRTVQLVQDIRRAHGDNTPSGIELPEIPTAPEPTPPPAEEDDPSAPPENADAACFVYEKVGNYYAIAGLTESGKARESLTVPYSYDGVLVTRILKRAFADATALREVTIQTNINQIQNEAFVGCSSLTSIKLYHTQPSMITVGMAGGLLEGVNEACKVYVPQESLSYFQNDYNWEAYRSQLRGYE